jgi:hemerythrin HHE cation binding domain-containing protein
MPTAAVSTEAAGMLSPLAWNVGFALGHPELDAQHRRLVVLINDVISAVEQKAHEKVPDLLNALASAAAEHFQAEMATLRELLSGTHPSIKGRPKTARLAKALAGADFDEHWAHHGALLNRLSALSALPPPVLCLHLKDWFVDHVIKQDSRLRAVFQAI